MGKGARGSGPRERMVPLINGAGATLRWFVRDVWSCFDDDHARPGAPLFCSERRNADGSAARAGNETLRSDLGEQGSQRVEDVITTARRSRAALDVTFPTQFRGLARQASPSLFPTIERAAEAESRHG